MDTKEREEAETKETKRTEATVKRGRIVITEPSRDDARGGVLIFTYPPDFSLAARAVSCASRTWSRTGFKKAPKFFWCVHKKHLEDAKKFFDEEWSSSVPDGTPVPELIEHEFDAGGHLQCLSACGGMKKVFWQLFHDKATRDYGVDFVIKLDSDALLLKPELWTNPWRQNRADYVYVPQAPCEQYADAGNPLSVGEELKVRTHLGCGWCYLISDYAASVIGSFPAEQFKRISFRNYGAEDRVFGIVLQDSPCVVTAEISPKNVIGRSRERAADSWTALIMDNPKENFGKARYSWTLEEFFEREA